ncbi:hypothetical protein D9M72_315490 [compost metagenome]
MADHGIAQVGLEGQVDVARSQHQRAVDLAAGRERQAQPAGPVRDLAGLAAEAPDPSHAGVGQADAQLGAGRRMHAHLARAAQALHGGAHGAFQRRVGLAAFQDLGMFVADHQQARHDAVGAAQDQRQFRRVQQAFHRAIQHQVAARQGRHHRSEALQGIAGAGGAHRRGRAKCGCRHLDAHRGGTQRLHGQLGQGHVDRAGLRLRYNSNDFRTLQGTEFQRAPERRQPAVFDLLDEHDVCLLLVVSAAVPALLCAPAQRRGRK